MALTFYEQLPLNGIDQPGGAGFSRSGGKAVAYYRLDDTSGDGSLTLDTLQTAITQLIGNTSYDVGDGRLNRNPPTAHPMFPWLLANNISRMWGIGNPQSTAAAPGLDIPPIGNFGLYPIYWFQVDFPQYGYPVSTDANITLNPSSWYNDSNSYQEFNWANEFERYADIAFMPSSSSDTNICQVAGIQGQYKFMTSSGLPGTPVQTYQGTTQMNLPNQIFKVCHFDVPYRWFTSANSYYRRWLNRVNQNAFYIQGYLFNAGELLLLGVSPTKHTPPIQQLDQFTPGIFSSQKNCDIELTFLYTTRKGTNVPTQPNSNLIYAGHNLLPWFPQKKYYLALSSDGTNSFTTYMSAPFEILATDPDAAGGIAP